MAKRLENRPEQHVVGPEDERLKAIGDVRQAHPQPAPADRRVLEKRPGGDKPLIIVAHDEHHGEPPAGSVVEPGEHPLGGEKRVWRLGLVEQSAPLVLQCLEVIETVQDVCGVPHGVAARPSAALFRLAGDAANQAVRVVAHSGISLRVDARHLGDGFPVWVGVFADDIQRVEGKH